MGSRPIHVGGNMIITIVSDEKEWDIQADENSSIQNTLKILRERGMLAMQEENIPKTVYSVRKRRSIDTERTYRESGIYQGDILKIR